MLASYPGNLTWNQHPPPEHPGTFGCLTEPGSLTDRLIATKHEFTVTLLRFGEDVAAPDEAHLVGIRPGDAITRRHVALSLGGQRVVMARSFCRRACKTWYPILNRGSNSLGLTLFSSGVDLVRNALEFATVGPDHPLFTLAQEGEIAASFSARRCRFEMQDAPLVVCEVFLPGLEQRLADA